MCVCLRVFPGLFFTRVSQDFLSGRGVQSSYVCFQIIFFFNIRHIFFAVECIFSEFFLSLIFSLGGVPQLKLKENTLTSDPFFVGNTGYCQCAKVW